MNTVATEPYEGQKPGTSGLRKKVREFQQPHYLENFVQSVFSTLGDCRGKRLVIGGDGRFYNREAIQTIIRMAVASGFKDLLIGQDGLLSTPAASCIVRKYHADGALILSASHNPGGPEEDFGIKFNGSNGGPASESVTERIYEMTRRISGYLIADIEPVDLSVQSSFTRAETTVTIIDPVSDYADLMASLFDFDAISRLLANSDFGMRFDGMNAVTGPYATEILERRLGAPAGTVIRREPQLDFGGLHPDPNLVHAATLVEQVEGDPAITFGAASDGDGDRNMVLGKGMYINPSDSLAIIAANAHVAPGYAKGLAGVARSMPTGRAVDRVAKELGIPCYETPTGWKFFGNLLDAGRITLCGEESFGTGSDHVREKDGLWAVLFWLNILAARGASVKTVVHQHWQRFGRSFFTRHDYEAVPTDKAQAVITGLTRRLASLAGEQAGSLRVLSADSFRYEDPVDASISENQGLRIYFDNGARAVVRLSGTGTSGATVRVYFDCQVDDPESFDLDTQVALAPTIAAFDVLSDLKAILEREYPDVIT